MKLNVYKQLIIITLLILLKLNVYILSIHLTLRSFLINSFTNK